MRNISRNMDGVNSGWFYSSLAQTSSSIVGLVGAVLGMHLIDHLTSMREERREVIDRINTVYRQMKERAEHWQKFKEELSEGKPAEADVKAEMELLQSAMPLYSPPDGLVSEAGILAFASRLRSTAAAAPQRSKTAHALTLDAAAMEKLAHRFGRFQLKLIPRSFVVVLLVLAWLSVTGIFWPLFLLTRFTEGYPQQLMVMALGAGVFALVGYFAFQLRVLTLLGRIYWTKPHEARRARTELEA